MFLFIKKYLKVFDELKRGKIESQCKLVEKQFISLAFMYFIKSSSSHGSKSAIDSLLAEQLYDNLSLYFCYYLFILSMINKMKLQSRTLVKDPLFEKSQKNIKNHHQQRLRDIYSHKKEAIKNDEHKKFSKQLRQSKEASHRIDQQFDPTTNQKKAFIQHMIKINYRANEHAKSMSLLNMYRSTKQQQKKRIMEENQRIVAKIKGRKPEVPTYSELKKDSLIYEGRKSRLIKANSQTLI